MRELDLRELDGSQRKSLSESLSNILRKNLRKSIHFEDGRAMPCRGLCKGDSHWIIFNLNVAAADAAVVLTLALAVNHNRFL